MNSSFIDDRNRENIKTIVKNNFGLDDESYDRFVGLLDEPDIDEVYKNILGDDLRARFPIDKFSLESYDASWVLFKTFFPTYVKEFNVNYRDYASGRVMVKKNELKIFKHLASYYLETQKGRSAFCYDVGIRSSYMDDVEKVFERNVNDIVKDRFPAKVNFEVVLSLNFADWFLCSTGETWTSCLNLESNYFASFWAGLPGFVADKNKAMIYITVGEKKEYQGIIVDKTLTRSFLTLNQNDKIRILRWYPTDIYFSNGTMDSLPFSMKYVDEYEDAIKYKLENPLYHSNGWICFAYQDKTMFRYSSQTNTKSIPFDIVSKGGQFYIDKDNNYSDNPIFSWTGGLKELIHSNKKIVDKVGEKCTNCGCTVHEDYRCEFNEKTYCEDCYSDLFRYCDHCDQSFLKSNVNDTRYGFYCSDCLDDVFTVCKKCGILLYKRNVDADDPLCDSCFRV